MVQTLVRNLEPAESSALFAVPARPRGRHERAMEATIREWRAAGKVIDPAMSVSLRSQAAAVDLAFDKRDYWHIGNANRVLAELRREYVDRLAGADPFDRFLQEMTADDSDPVTGAPPAAAASEVRHPDQ